MKVYKPCNECKGIGTIPVISQIKTMTHNRGDYLGYDNVCPVCKGSGKSTVIIYIIE